MLILRAYNASGDQILEEQLDSGALRDQETMYDPNLYAMDGQKILVPDGTVRIELILEFNTQYSDLIPV